MFLFRGSLYLYDVAEAYISMTSRKLMSLWRQLFKHVSMASFEFRPKFTSFGQNYDENCDEIMTKIA